MGAEYHTFGIFVLASVNQVLRRGGGHRVHLPHDWHRDREVDGACHLRSIDRTGVAGDVGFAVKHPPHGRVDGSRIDRGFGSPARSTEIDPVGIDRACAFRRCLHCCLGCPVDKYCHMDVVGETHDGGDEDGEDQYREQDERSHQKTPA